MKRYRLFTLTLALALLSGNAVAATPPDGKVTVVLERLGTELILTVEDSGPGINPANLEKIFERFYTDRPGQTFGGNSGLGLAISKKLANFMGGDISLESELGKGSTFMLVLPLSRLEPQAG